MIKSAPKVTAKQVSKNTFEDKKYMNHVINSNYPGKRTFLTPYTWNLQKDDQDTEVYSQNLKKMLNNLLKTKIRDEDSMLLKSEDRPPCNPALVMDLRHEMVS
jgi:cell division protein YceG involved in septum cleavage